MFKRLSFQVKTLFISAVSFFVVLITIVTIVNMHFYYMRDFDSYTMSETQVISNSFQLHNQIIYSTLQGVSNNQIIKNYISGSSSYQETQDYINVISVTYNSLLGISLYTTDNRIVSSSSIGGPATLVELQQVVRFSSFISSSDTSTIFIRNKAIANNYLMQPYNDSLGLLSLFLKVYDGNENVIGYIVADYDTNYLYSTIFDISEYTFFENGNTYISDNTSILYLVSEDIDMYDVSYPYSEKMISNLNGKLYSKINLTNAIDFTVIIPEQNKYYNTNMLIIIFLSVDIIIMAFTIIISAKMAYFIKKPLIELHSKINQQNDI